MAFLKYPERHHYTCDQVSPVAVITHNVTAASADKHSEVADVTDDGDKPTLTLRTIIVETPTAAADRSFAGVAASNMDAWHTVSRNRQTRPSLIGRRNEQEDKDEMVL